MTAFQKLLHYTRRLGGRTPFLTSMSGRVFAILLIGTVSSAALAWWLAFGERQRVVNQLRDQRVLERAEQLIYALDAVPGEGRDDYLYRANRPGLRAEKVQDDDHAAPKPTPLARALGNRLGGGYRVTSLGETPSECTPLRADPEQRAALEPFNSACESMHVRLRDGGVLRLSVLAPRTLSIWHASFRHVDFLSTIPLFLSSIVLLAYLVARMTMAPLMRLAQAAKDLGADINRPPLPAEGVSEIREAANAFNAMQARIRQHIGQRTQMLAAITHDLQTPLTRLRLRLEKVDDDELREKLIGDLSAMQAMVREGLDLARSMDSGENMQVLDLDSMLDSICSDALDAGQDVKLSGHAGVAIMARPTALQRCLTNLIDNAVKYGRYAHLTVERLGANGARIRVRDGGPGIPPGELGRVFDPFYRVETSRSRESGGTGLGLTIARNIAELHGGALQVANHPEGGLEATLTLHQPA
jgi:signal transduction histidine kinase